MTVGMWHTLCIQAEAGWYNVAVDFNLLPATGRSEGGVMRDYVNKCMANYVESVWRNALRYERQKKVVRRGTIALIDLTAEKGCGAWVSRQEISSRAGLEKGTGLWPWIEAGVVDKGRGLRRIRPEFYLAMRELTSESGRRTNQTTFLLM